MGKGAVKRFIASNDEDVPAYEDALDIEQYYKGFASYIRKCDTPMTVALQGGWGTGKTSFFNFVQQELKDDEKIRTVPVSTWPIASIDMGDGLIIHLILKIIDAVSSDLSTSTEVRPSAKDAAIAARKKRLRLIADGLSTAFGAVVEYGLGLGILGDAAKNVLTKALDVEMQDGAQPTDEAETSNPFDRLLEVKKQLEELIREDPTLERLVVFVDDLDRLEPKQAVSFLEQIKNFMDCDGCVFVLAIDEDVVFDGVVKKYGDQLGGERKRLFFDKIIQIPFEMPVERYDVPRYIRSLLAGESEEGKESERDQQTEEFAEAVSMLYNRDRPGGVQSQNPRAIKRYLNLYKLYKEIFLAPHRADGVSTGHMRVQFLEDLETQVCLFALIVFRENNEEAFDKLVESYANDEPTSPLDGFDGDEACRQAFKRLKTWIEAKDGRRIKLESVIYRVMLGDDLNFTKCLQAWGLESIEAQDSNKKARGAQALNMKACEMGLLVKENGGGLKVTAKGSALGLTQSIFRGLDGGEKPYVTVSKPAQKKGSRFYTEVAKAFGLEES